VDSDLGHRSLRLEKVYDGESVAVVVEGRWRPGVASVAAVVVHEHVTPERRVELDPVHLEVVKLVQPAVRVADNDRATLSVIRRRLRLRRNQHGVNAEAVGARDPDLLPMEAHRHVRPHQVERRDRVHLLGLAASTHDLLEKPREVTARLIKAQNSQLVSRNPM